MSITFSTHLATLLTLYQLFRPCSAGPWSETAPVDPALQIIQYTYCTMNDACSADHAQDIYLSKRNDVTLSRHFLVPCASQRTRNNVFLPREPYAERWCP